MTIKEELDTLMRNMDYNDFERSIQLVRNMVSEHVCSSRISNGKEFYEFLDGAWIEIDRNNMEINIFDGDSSTN